MAGRGRASSRFTMRFRPTSAVTFVLLLHLAAGVGTNAQQAVERGGRQILPITLPAAARGEQAIQALGEHLPAVALAHGKTVEELTDLFGRDHTLTVDRHGRLFYADEDLPLPKPAAALDSGTVAVAASYPLDQTFFLHSRPGAKKIIYLDFNGHVLSGTSWNANYTGGQSINCPPFDFEGGPSVFTSSELSAIQQIWHRV